MVNGGKDIQRERGFVAIHPAILELLATQVLSGREFRCLLFLFRKTYGFQKKEERISLSQWADGTRISRTKVGDVLEGLVTKRIIYRNDAGPKRPATWGFNKYYEHWQSESVPLQGYSLASSVPLQGDSLGNESVPLQGYRLKPSVPLQGDKSVPLQGDNNRYKEKETPPPIPQAVEVVLPASFSTPTAQDGYRKAVVAWEGMGIFLNTVIEEDMKEAVNTWDKRGHPEYVEEAIKIAARNGVRKWAYVAGILRRCEDSGKAPGGTAPTEMVSAGTSGIVDGFVFGNMGE